jgi:DNA repair protein RadA/Sms
MAKAAKPHFYCSQCGHEASRWFGRCPACQAWNSATEAPVQGAADPKRRNERGRWRSAAATPAAPRPLAEVEVEHVRRSATGFAEIDRVLGGGLVPGSLLLVGGDPGIGKSTLLLQLACALAAAGQRVLYVTGEESEDQIRLRASRIGPVADSLLVLCETDVDALLEAATAAGPAVLIVDSIQTLSRGDVEGAPGAVTQIRECGLTLMHFSKATRTTVFLVGHVTKDGAVAGPRVLEHMVDAVLYLEGERYQHYRVLRAAKNRFGSTDELGVFEMTGAGLVEVANPSAAFLSESQRSEPGSAVVASLEGTRPLLVEVQALVSTSFYGTPQRVTSGFDPRRLAVLLAVLERRVGLRLGRHDVFVTVTGGLRLDEPGTDLGVLLAVASSFTSRPVLPRTLAVGEVSLSGELRRVSRLGARVREAAQLGFERVGVPNAQAGEAEGLGVEIVALTHVRDAIERLLGVRIPRASAGASSGRGPGAAEEQAGAPGGAASRPGVATGDSTEARRTPDGGAVRDARKPEGLGARRLPVRARSAGSGSQR